MSFWKRLLLVWATVVMSFTSFAQEESEQVDSLVTLLSAKSMQLIEVHGVSYRKVIGPARFYHNNTYLICDTALWNVNSQQIDAIGNVRILQESTELTSDNLIYHIDQDLAQFRGSLVQLEDKDRNTLRTNYLDYNTKDSVAVFMGGASMRDKDGQIIESLNGTYDSKIKTFTFTDNVNMFSDSIFVKTSRLVYNTDRNFAEFGRDTDAWKDDGMLSSDAGWYDRNREIFFFTKSVHGMTNDQEAWSDSLFFYRRTTNVEMFGNVQLLDTTRNATALSGHLLYEDALSQVTMTKDPSIVVVTDTTGTAIDSVFVRGDMLKLKSVQKCDIDSLEFTSAAQRIQDMSADAIGTYRKNAAEEARIAAENARMKDPEYMAEMHAKQAKEAQANQLKPGAEGQTPAAGADSTGKASPVDSLSNPLDSLAVAIDSTLVSEPLPEPVDTTKVGFIYGYGNIRLYREDFQMSCDTLKFNELDSLVRLYVNPLVWNEGNRQYAADSIYVSFGENNLDKAYLMSNAFITVKETEDCYDQIRSTEMLAFFDDQGGLRRFDAMGGVDAVFYLKEDSTYATVNKSQAKLLTAALKDGTIDTVSYFEEAKNDAYPLAQLSVGDRVLKGFNWKPELRPSSPSDIVKYPQRKSERTLYLRRPKARFRETDRYFPGYMSEIYKLIEENKKKSEKKDTVQAAQDTTSLSEVLVDTMSVDKEVTPVDSTTQVTAKDTVVAVQDSTIVREESSATEKELRKAAKKAAREAKWARLDSLDAAKLAAKQEAVAEKARKKKLKTIEAQLKQEKKDAERLERYILRFERRRNKKSGTSEFPEIPETEISVSEQETVTLDS